MKKRDVAILGAAILCAFLVGCGKGPTSIVKHGTLEFDTSVEVGNAFDGYKYFKKTNWRSFETSQGRTVVEFTALMNLDAYKNAQYGTQLDGIRITEEMVDKTKNLGKNLEVEYVAQFLLSKTDNTFKVSHSAIKLLGITAVDAKQAKLEVEDDDLSTIKCIYADKPDVRTVGMLMTFWFAAQDKAKNELAAAEMKKAQAAEDKRKAEEQAAAKKLRDEAEAAVAEKRKAIVAKLQSEIAELKSRLANNDAEEKKELDGAERSFASKISTLKGEAQSLLLGEEEMQKQMTALKQQHDPLKKQMDDMNAMRSGIDSRYAQLVGIARTNATNAQAAAEKFKTESLSAAAKFINDTIVYRRLTIEHVPSDGKFSEKAKGGATPNEFVGEVFENGEERLDIGQNITTAKVGDLLPNRDGYVSVYARMSQQAAGGGMSVQSKMSLVTTLHVKTFSRFPTALDDVRARQTFVQMYWRYARNMPAYETASQKAQAQQAAVENEARQSLQTWDTQNGQKLKELQGRVSALAAQIAESNSKLSSIKTERTAKESILNKPQPDQLAAIRQEISAKNTEKKRPLTEQVASLEAKMKERASQPVEKAIESQLAEKAVDTKTEHLGLQLGSLRSELKLGVIKEKEESYKALSERGVNEYDYYKDNIVWAQVPDGAVFGNIPISALRLVYLADRLIEIRMDMIDETHSRTEESKREAWHILFEALVEKYGKPTSPELKDKSDHKDVSEATWQGNDIVLEYRYFDLVSLLSKRVAKEAEQELIKRSLAKDKDMTKKALDLKSKL